ncbi:MAG: glycosyltransferase [Acidobacteria bacterium]|nr:glycosyltransferase [Acidobacteriota bacterium]MCA1610806.1 glycosyltransferase [Acidobacteriota bacterium]
MISAVRNEAPEDTSRRALEGLRVAFVSGTLGQGGAERQLYYMVQALLESGARPRVYSLSRGEFWEEKIAALGAPVAWVGQRGAKALRLAALVRALRKDGADVVQSQHFYTNLYSAVAARVLGLQEVGAIRNTVDYELRSTGRLLGNVSLRSPRRLAANSASAVVDAIRRGVPASRVFLLPNVVDTSRFAPGPHPRPAASAADPRPAAGVRLLAAGRLVPQKRFDRFLRALAAVRRQSAVAVTGLIVGSGPLRGELETLARELGLSADAVEFRGAVPDMRAAYLESDVFVLTSDHEGTPNVVLEAMASALPVVTTRVGGVTELIDSGKTGMVVEPRDDEGLSAALAALAADPDARKRVGRDARESILATASLARLPDYLSRLYGSER